jgi:hypothetical protein
MKNLKVLITVVTLIGAIGNIAFAQLGPSKTDFDTPSPYIPNDHDNELRLYEYAYNQLFYSAKEDHGHKFRFPEDYLGIYKGDCIVPGPKYEAVPKTVNAFQISKDVSNGDLILKFIDSDLNASIDENIIKWGVLDNYRILNNRVENHQKVYSLDGISEKPFNELKKIPEGNYNIRVLGNGTIVTGTIGQWSRNVALQTIKNIDGERPDESVRITGYASRDGQIPIIEYKAPGNLRCILEQTKKTN